MTGEAVVGTLGRARDRGGVPVWRLAWRNLWRNRRRTWLTAGGIGFAVFLLVVAVSMQDGSFTVMIDNAARLLVGHVQVQASEYHDDPVVEHRLVADAPLLAEVEAMPHVTAVLPRAVGFALASSGERSFGAQVLGVMPARELRASSLPAMVERGRYLERPGEAFVGTILARNLGIEPGDDIVMLGTAVDGGVAAAAATVVGTFATGQAEIERSLVQIHIDDFRPAWNLGPSDVQTLVVLLDDPYAGEALAAGLAAPGRAVLDWRRLMPEAQQTIEFKRVGSRLFFALVAIIVTFSVVNTFMMTVFERTPEFGMLMALGMRHGAIVGQLCLEAMWLALLGIGLGLAVSSVLVAVLAGTGLPLPADAVEVLARYNMPERMYPAFSLWAAVVASVVMLAGAQLAVLVPALRVRRLRPVEALRGRD